MVQEHLVGLVGAQLQEAQRVSLLAAAEQGTPSDKAFWQRLKCGV